MEQQIVEYDILKNEDTGQLAIIVNKLIKQGWQPFGSMHSYIRKKEGLIFYLQPIVKYGPIKKRRTGVLPR